MARLGLALAAAVLGLATVTAVAAADPTDTTSPPTSSSPAPTEPSEPSGPPSEPSTPPSSESSEPPQSEEPPTTAAIEDIEATAEFHKPSYATGETIEVTLTLTNTGEYAQRLDVFFPSYDKADGIQVNGFGNFGRDVLVDPGGSVTGVLTGEMLNPNVDKATLYVDMRGDSTTRNLEFSVPVTRRVATVSGTVYNDRNGDGNIDSGEGIEGARLEFTNKRNVFVRLYTSTNAAGAFAIEVVPGDYYVDVEAAGMLTVEDQITVPESGVDGLVFRTRQVLTAALGVDLEFTKDTYKPTETPTVRVTLANKGDTRLSDIVARCTHYDGGPHLTGTTAGWGALAGEGLTLAPHTTTVLEVTEPMPAGAYNYGYVEANCQFAYADMPGNGFPSDTDRAAMPGQLVEVTGQINSYVEGSDMTGFRVVLTADGGGCPIIAEAVTGRDGKFSLGKVQAGRYHYYIVPPPPGWWFKLYNHGDTQVVAGQTNHWSFLAAPSPGNNNIVLPPDCPGGPPGTNPPGPQGSPGTNLAYTGTSLVVPGVAGLLALLVGGATVFLSRRRRPVEDEPAD